MINEEEEGAKMSISEPPSNMDPEKFEEYMD